MAEHSNLNNGGFDPFQAENGPSPNHQTKVFQHSCADRIAQLRTFLASEMLTWMTEADQHWGLSNPGPDTLLVWLEPWADEIEVAVRSTITFDPSGGPEDSPLGQLEWTTDHLIVWATAQRIAVRVDGVLQHSGSAVIPVPDGLTKGMLGIVFADQPAARLGGARSVPIERASWWQLIKRRLGV